VEFHEIQVDQETANDALMDIEGEQDFVMPSLDADPDVDVL
jgi:hypothetical protein